jgi:uncharacterized protein YbbC (DUF1343 family)
MGNALTKYAYNGYCKGLSWNVSLEGTNISEGRGTTRPFEIFGAPFIEPELLVRQLKEFNLPGIIFRPTYFQPTFQKYAGKVCEGAQLHVTDRERFKPFKTGVAIIKAVYDFYPEDFSWRQPPYEYETEKLPIDILAGTDRLRKGIEEGEKLDKMEDWWQEQCNQFDRVIRKKYLIYHNI